jgi:hypothetical protein
MPPHFERRLQNVASLIPCLRYNSTTAMPLSMLLQHIDDPVLAEPILHIAHVFVIA